VVISGKGRGRWDHLCRGVLGAMASGAVVAGIISVEVSGGQGLVLAYLMRYGIW